MILTLRCITNVPLYTDTDMSVMRTSIYLSLRDSSKTVYVTKQMQMNCRVPIQYNWLPFVSNTKYINILPKMCIH